MFELLKQKGYKGKKDHLQALAWLKALGIYIEISIVWAEGGEQIYGYYAKCWLKPYKNAYITNTVNTFKDAIEGAVYSLIDYIPEVK